MLEARKNFPAGASVDQVSEVLAGRLPRRTLQRRLALLVEQSRLICEGHGPATHYLLPKFQNSHLGGGGVVLGTWTEATYYPPLSAADKALRDAIRVSIQERQPVGYNREFLEAYRPNETWCLPAQTRDQLAAMGTPKLPERLAGTYARQIFNRLLIDLSWNSSRLEGNIYSLLETERLLDLGAAAALAAFCPGGSPFAGRKKGLQQ